MHAYKVGLLIGTVLAAVPALAQDGTRAEQGLPATTQDQPSLAAEEGQNGASAGDIVVTGIRSSLANSARVKREAQQIVDSISAEDVGKFPDANVSESLQRITGVAIDRSGGEGQFITVRGLGPEFNTVLVNGRIMATDNPGREFSFDVLSSNMIQRTDVFKSSVPDLQEGGIGATVNIITARPLDQREGLHFAASAGGIYDTLSEKLGPDASAVVSWTNADKTFGAVLSGAYSKRKNQADQIAVDGWINGRPDIISMVDGAPSLVTGSDSRYPRAGNVNVPQSLYYQRVQETRERINVAGSVQYRPADNLEITVDGIYSKFDVSGVVRRMDNFLAAPYLEPTFNDNGTATSLGMIGADFIARYPQFLEANRDRLTNNGLNAKIDHVYNTTNRQSDSYQVGGNVKWNPGEGLEVRFDASLTGANRKSPNRYLVIGALLPYSYQFDLEGGAGLPSVSFDNNIINDPDRMRLHYMAVDRNTSRDRGSEFHLDTKFDVNDSVLRSVMIGGSYTQRRKTNRSFNNSDSNCTYCGYQVPIEAGLLKNYEWGSLLGTGDSIPPSLFEFDADAMLAYLNDPATLAIPSNGRTPEEQAAFAQRVLALPGGPFGVREQLRGTVNVQEKLTAGYISMQFGGSNWSGNVGVRVIKTDVVSSGFNTPVTSINNTPGDDTLQYTYGPATAVSVRNSYVNALPSANIKINITDNFITRAAFSQTVTRPTLTDLGVNNDFGGRISVPQSSGGNPGLLPFKSTNYDLSAEWYLSPVSYLSVGAFYKDLSNFLELQTLPVVRFGRTFQDTRTRNGQTGYIRGIEVGGQYAFDWLPGLASGFGVAGNYTYVSSKVERDQTLADYDCGYNGLSPHSANGSIFYEKFGISARASYNWRSDYLRSCRSSQGRPRNRSSYGQLDFNLGYDVTENVQVYLQGVNVLNEKVDEWSAIEERYLLLEETGARYNFGVRVRF
ncbi:TonB-dependent receptor [Sphingomonas desiccabilis]|uniref:TonB-dependent receptor n=1 Tax=Sphingomonas desiccabilis TaxID=429134 RepID=A0A4Q2IQ76_9SPHN|nr:TonB-dependent receptor [Sphingomonas desiccabilis]MBB3911483.1 TonB-dependent receptor [Sphingomonas desiccabilis]RXZ31752.1 TonB-dependent receptor [Sphingomonas desiccabilis]